MLPHFSLAVHCIDVCHNSRSVLSVCIMPMSNYNIIVRIGHKDTVLLLLQAGARRSTVNNMGKTVMQLGSFVGEY